MEGATLDPRGGPHAPGGLGEPRAAVTHHHAGRSDAGQQGRPGTRVLASCHVPPEDMLVRAGYEHDDVASDPYPVNVDDIEDLVHEGRQGPYVPEPGGPPPEGPPATRQVGLSLTGEQPCQEPVQRLRGSIYPMDERCPADEASPALPPCGRPATPLGLAPAVGAPHLAHRTACLRRRRHRQLTWHVYGHLAGTIGGISNTFCPSS